MKCLEFFVPLKKIPGTTHQQKKISVVNGTPIVYENSDLREARSLFLAYFSKHVPRKPFDGPIQLTTKWLYPTKDKSKKDGQWKTTKPDTDNLVKLPKDCMTELGYWKDDALIASEIIQKFWVKDSPSGIYIRIEVLK